MLLSAECVYKITYKPSAMSIHTTLQTPRKPMVKKYNSFFIFLCRNFYNHMAVKP